MKSIGTDTLNALTQKELKEYISKAPVTKPKGFHGIPFSKMQFNKIIAYDFDGHAKEGEYIIDSTNTFTNNITKQKYLTQIQADKILPALSSNKSYGEASAACFEPKLNFIFYNNDTLVNRISICLDCNNSLTDIYIPARNHNLINKGTDSEYTFTGYTKFGKWAIIKLCKELNFKYGTFEIK